MAKKKNEKTSKVAESNNSDGVLSPEIGVETTNVRPPTPTEDPVAEVKDSTDEVHQVAMTDSAVNDNQQTSEAADGGESTNTLPSNSTVETTNFRPLTATQKLVADLKELAKDDRDRSFDIGDLVEVATSKHKMKVGDLVDAVGLSRQRLCDCRMTAVAFRAKSRRNDVPFHFFTLAARASKKFGIEADKAIETVYQQKLQSVREVSRHFAKMGQKKETGKALANAALLVASNGELLDRCHHDDFRTVSSNIQMKVIRVMVRDVSSSGIGFTCHEKLTVGLEMNLCLPDYDSATVEVPTRIVNCTQVSQDMYLVGGRFNSELTPVVETDQRNLGEVDSQGMNLSQLLYISDATASMSQAELSRLIAKCRRNNCAAEATGLLVYSAGHFIQLLEGNWSTIAKLYSFISSDPRHYNVRQLYFGPSDRRLFPKWEMGLLDCSCVSRLDRASLLEGIDLLKTRPDATTILHVFRRFSLQLPKPNIQTAQAA
jgi:hypothetical protein